MSVRPSRVRQARVALCVACAVHVSPAAALQGSGQVDAISREFTIWVQSPAPQQVDAISREITIWTSDPSPQQADAISREFTLRLPMPDLVTSGLSTPPASLTGTTYQVSWTVSNIGDGGATGSWTDRVLATTNTSLGDADDVVLGNFAYTGSIPVATGIQRTQTITLPATPGTWYLAVVTDNAQALPEIEEANNAVLSGVFTLLPSNPPKPDLTASILTAPTSNVDSGQSITVQYRITNNGTAATDVPQWTDRVWLTTSNAPGTDPTGGVLLGSYGNVSFLATGASYDRTVTVTLPSDFAGTRHIAVRADANGQVTEGNGSGTAETNNDVFSAGFQVDLEDQPDLVVQFDPHTPTIVFSGTYLDPTELDWIDVNQGIGITNAGSWSDRVWLSLDNNPSITAGDIDLGTSPYSGGILGPFGQAPRSGSFFLDVDLQGTYFVKVQVDSGNAISELGFEGNNVGVRPDAITVILNQTPDLVPSGVQRLGAGNALAGHPIVFEWSVDDLSPGATDWETGIGWIDRLYLSSNTTYEQGVDVQLWSAGQTANIVGGTWVPNCYTGAPPVPVLENKICYEKSASAALPQSLAAGTWYMIARIDADGAVFEHDAGYDAEANNVLTSLPFQVAVEPTDLQIASVDGANPASGAAGVPITLRFDVTNAGSAPTNVASWVDRVYLSADTALSGNDPQVGSATRSAALDNGASYTVTVSGTVPLVAGGDYHLLYVCDAGGAVWELNGEGNNLDSRPFTVLPQTANLVASAVNAPDAVAAGTNLTVGWRVTNIGTLATPASSWSDRVWLSLDTSLGGDTLIGSKTHGSTLGAGSFYDETGSFPIPAGTSGMWYVLVETDGGGQVFEGSEMDNVAWDRMQVTVTTTPPPNLVLDAVSAASAVVSGQPLAVSWSARNAGAGGTATSSWSDSVYLSLDQTLDVGTDTYLGFWNHSGHLAPGETYSETRSFTVPLGVAGSRFAIVRANSNAALTESSTLDNARASPTLTNITLPPSCDLVATSIVPDAQVVPGSPLGVSWTTTNESGSAVSGSWTDTLFLSQDGVLDGSDVLLGQVIASVASLPVSGTYQQSASLTVPGVPPGLYRVLVWTDTLSQVPETDESDNQQASAALVDCVMPVLAPGGSLTLPLANGAQRYVRLDAPAGQAVRLRLVHDSPTAWTELYASHSSIPAPGVADVAFDSPGASEQVIVVPAGTGQPWYVLARTPYGASAQQPGGTLSAELLPFEIESVLPTVAGRGVVTLELVGGRLDTLTGAQLRANGGTRTYSASTVQALDETRGLALFDLSGATPGLYDVIAYGSKTATLLAVVTVQDAGPIAVKAALELAPSVKKGSTGVGALRIGNAGDVNLPWGLLALGTAATDAAHLGAPSVGMTDLESGQPADTALFLIDDLGPSQSVELALQLGIDANAAADDLAFALTGRALSDADLGALLDATAESLRQRVLADPASGATILALASSPSAWLLAAQGGYPADPSALHVPGASPRTGRELVEDIADSAAAAAGTGGSVPPTAIDAALGDLACLWLAPAGFDCGGLALAGCTDGLAEADVTQVAGLNVPQDEVCVSTPTSDDPNEKDGPPGFGQQGLVASGDGLTYRVYFENVATAAAPAALVTIEDPLEAGLLASTFRATTIRFGDTLLDLPENSPNYSNVFDLSPTHGVNLQVVAGVDGATNQAFWILSSLDPATGLPVTDGVRGFLPPNDGTGRGSGYVEFVVSSPPSGPVTGTVVANRAGVRFDVNPTFHTNTVQNSLDADDPASTVSASPIAGDDFSFQVSWSGADPDGGSGLESYTVLISTDDGPYVPLATDTAATAHLFEGEPGRTYRFYSRARDHTGRREAAAVLPDVVVALPQDCNQNGVGDPTDIGSGASQDCDANAVPDECQPDGDGDGAIDACDGCPSDPLKTAPGACGCGVADGDTDGDGTHDCNDGCPSDPGKTQPGQCGCGVPDIDTDADGVADCLDNCDALPNPSQKDCDQDGEGDACELAAGAPDCNGNGLPDNCDIASGASKDRNANGVPDECDPVPPWTFCIPGTAPTVACPCGNPPAMGGVGCNNSALTGGGRLSFAGVARLSADSLILRGTNMLPNALAIYLQGNVQSVNGIAFGDGVRCAAGALKRLGQRANSNGASSYPVSGDLSISSRSALLGDPIAPGQTRWYQVFYRDPNPTYACPAPANFNLTGGLRVVWVN